MERVCGTCKYAHDEGNGQTVCHRQGAGHWYGVVTTKCRQPRKWWEERPTPIEVPATRTEADGQLVLAL